MILAMVRTGSQDSMDAGCIAVWSSFRKPPRHDEVTRPPTKILRVLAAKFGGGIVLALFLGMLPRFCMRELPA
jgi:hypothetical protein